jgi:predicted nucleotidyltransferase
VSEGLRILESKRAEIARLCQAHAVVRLLASLEESLERKVDLIDCGYITKDWTRETLEREALLFYEA